MNKKIKFILFHGQRQIKSYKLRKFLAKLQGYLLGKIILSGKSNLIPAEIEKVAVSELDKNGFYEIPTRLSDEIIDEIKQATISFKLFDPFNRDLGDFKKSEIAEKTHVANFYRHDLTRCKNIVSIANDPGVLRIVQDYLGCKPTISNINMWWSIAGKESAKDAQLFHRDVDDIKFCKLFIYLTDVAEIGGPHTYVKGSSSTDKLTKIRRYQDSEIIEAFGAENVLHFVKPKGSCFLVDTYGFHKGTLPIENDRLLLQVQYSINPIGIEDYSIKQENQGFQKYINRLILE
jgi:hypothetical protein